MTANTFYYDSREDIYDEHGESIVDPMECVLTNINDPNIVLETITIQRSYLSLKPQDKEILMEDKPLKKVEPVKSSLGGFYRHYNDQIREIFIDWMIEGPVERGRVTSVGKKFRYKASYRYALVEILPRDGGSTL